MRPNKARFVTACQQLLAVGAVLSVLGPAADVVSLDVVVTRPGPVDARTGLPALTRQPGVPLDRRVSGEDEEESRVETAPVEPAVTEVPMRTESKAKQPRAEGREFTSQPAKVQGFGTVGVTWSHRNNIADDEIKVLVRTKREGAWSEWARLEYHDDHGPDPDSAEGRASRPGTDPLIVGHVDEVQAKAITSDGTAADDVQMSVIEPGRSKGTDEEAPAIDTAELGGGEGGDGATEELATSEGDLALQAGSYTPKPQIYSRAQWGANERMRDAGSLHYFEVHAGFVHHTVNANNYTRDEVPGILRSIYAYHTQTRGWSDVGYNFLVDRFGRIWEGRYGGVDRPVVGAHTLNYNDYAFAMSAIGNFENVQPSSAMLQAYGKLFAWKLSLHGIDADSTSQNVGGRRFQAVNGHRDAAATACPGRYLYAKIPTIRTLAAQIQADWSGRDRDTDVVGTGHPDLLVRRTSDKAAFVVPTGGMLRLRAPRVLSTDWSRYDTVVASPDLSGDGTADLMVRNASTGNAGVRAGRGDGTFAPVKTFTTAFRGFDQITAVGDLNRRGRSDIVARKPDTGRLYLFRGTSDGFSRILLSDRWKGYNLTAASGDLNGDGFDDLVSRDASGVLWLHSGTGRAALCCPGQALRRVGTLRRDHRLRRLQRRRPCGPLRPIPGQRQRLCLPRQGQRHLRPLAGSAGGHQGPVRRDRRAAQRHEGRQTCSASGATAWSWPLTAVPRTRFGRSRPARCSRAPTACSASETGTVTASVTSSPARPPPATCSCVGAWAAASSRRPRRWRPASAASTCSAPSATRPATAGRT